MKNNFKNTYLLDCYCFTAPLKKKKKGKTQMLECPIAVPKSKMKFNKPITVLNENNVTRKTKTQKFQR